MTAPKLGLACLVLCLFAGIASAAGTTPKKKKIKIRRNAPGGTTKKPLSRITPKMEEVPPPPPLEEEIPPAPPIEVEESIPSAPPAELEVPQAPVAPAYLPTKPTQTSSSSLLEELQAKRGELVPTAPAESPTSKGKISASELGKGREKLKPASERKVAPAQQQETELQRHVREMMEKRRKNIESEDNDDSDWED